MASKNRLTTKTVALPMTNNLHRAISPSLITLSDLKQTRFRPLIVANFDVHA